MILIRLLVAVAVLATIAPPAGGQGSAPSEAAAAAEAPPPALQLRPVPALRPPAAGERGAVFLRADRIEGQGNRTIEASGNVELRSYFESFIADWLSYDVENDEVRAKGNVRVRRGDDTVSGPELRYRRSDSTGSFTAPEFTLGESNSRGSAAEFQFTGPDTFAARDGLYTACRAGDESWYLRVGSLEIDRGRDVGIAHNVSVIFQGLPILYSPWLSFPIGKDRKSGFLTPSLGSTGSRGLEARIPYYFNLAPNYDATLAPRVMSRRGLQINGQFRYLFADNQGEINAEVLPHDRVLGSDRWGMSWRHAHDLGGGIGAFTNLNRVSDNTYFSDLGERISVTSQTTLPQEFGLTYTAPGISVLARIQKFQTLQDPNQPILPPYERVPQLALNAQVYDWNGLDAQAFAELATFRHPTLATGDRLVLYPWASYTHRRAAYFVTGRVGTHLTHYELDDPTLPERTVDRVVPIASLDAGLAFERNWRVADRDFIQTLEPRAYYVYVPYRRQEQIPSFDTAIADLNFAQLFSENRYVGHDRINDANQLTLAITSRLLEPGTGDERLRMALGQRFYFSDQRVALNEVPRVSKSSDVLVAAGGRLSSAWFADFGLQYGPGDARLERFNGLLRYQPAAGRVIGLGYRYIRELIDQAGSLSKINQIDIGAQWPVYGDLTLLARWNYSFFDSRVLEGIAGVEYNGDCWVLRVVGHRLATTTQTAQHSIFVQLELNGLSGIGTNPFDLLRRSIPGYVKINDPVSGGSVGERVFDPRF